MTIVIAFFNLHNILLDESSIGINLPLSVESVLDYRRTCHIKSFD